MKLDVKSELTRPIISTTSQTINIDNITIFWSYNINEIYEIYVNGELNCSSTLDHQNIKFWNNGTYNIKIRYEKFGTNLTIR